jgi:hypothetical protein
LSTVTLPLVTLEGGLVGGGPRFGHLDGQVGEVLPGQAGEDSSH